MKWHESGNWTAHLTPFKTPLRKIVILPQFRHLCTVRFSEMKKLNMWKSNSPIQATPRQVWLLSVCLCKCVNTQNYTDGRRAFCYLVYPSTSSSAPFPLNLGYFWWFLCCFCGWRAAMCKNLSGGFIWHLIYYIKVQHDIFGLYKEGNKTNFDKILHFFLQTKPGSPAVKALY